MQRSEVADYFESSSLPGTQLGWLTAAAGEPEVMQCLSAYRSDSEQISRFVLLPAARLSCGDPTTED